MSSLPPPPPPPPPPPAGRGAGPGGNQTPGGRTPGKTGSGLPRWSIFVLIGVLVIALFGSQLFRSSDSDKVTYTEFLTNVQGGHVKEVTLNNQTLAISGKDDHDKSFSSDGPPNGFSDADIALLTANHVAIK